MPARWRSMRFLAAFPVLFFLVLAGCIGATVEPSAPADGIPVLVVGGTVVESGPQPEPQGVCDVAAPPFSADDDQRRLWYVPTDWSDDPRTADLAAVHVDRTQWLWDDGCWTYRLVALDGADTLLWWHDEIPQTLPIRLTDDGVEVDGVLLRPGEETDWVIDVSCQCTQHGVAGTYHYMGTLHIQYMGVWEVEVVEYEGLPPLDIPYWDGY